NIDLKCGILYIPPIGSKYSHVDPYFEIQNELFRFCSENDHILLLGDMNSRCGNLHDFTFCDNVLSDLFDLHDGPKLWDSSKSANFVDNIDILKVSDIESKLDLLSGNNQISQNDIDDVVNDIAILFSENAVTTFGMVHKREHNVSTQNDSHWFNR
ncbi:hypothetical protein MAR_013069, partial [Mya arenaria]